MTLDRTKPPPLVRIERASDGCWDAWWDGDVVLHRLGLDSEEEAIRLAWADYDRITLPARVALLRELAAEFDRPDPVRPPPYDDTLDRTLAEAVSSNNDPHGAIAIELLRRADALEAGGQTDEPTPTR